MHLPETHAIHPPRGFRILFVEDDEVVASLLAELLIDEGYAVAVVHDGVRALERIRDDRADAIVLDLKPFVIEEVLTGLDSALTESRH